MHCNLNLITKNFPTKSISLGGTKHNVINCITCEEFKVAADLDKKKCIFETGSSDFKLDSVIDHEQSKPYKKSTGIT